MNTRHTLQDYEGPLRTSMGACFPGERTVFRGHDLHAHLHDIDWVELYTFGITGRRFSAPQLKLLHALWSTTSYPDARLWNNRVAALAGSARSTASLAIAAALAVSEAGIYGWQPVIAIADFLLRARRQLDAGEDLQQVLRQELQLHRHIGGYGRPVATLKVDERIAAILALMERERLAPGPCLKLAFAIEQGLLQLGRNLPINYAPVLAAIPLDMGFSVRECHLFVQPCLMAGMPPCYLEALQRPEGATFAMRCTKVHYEGPARRQW
ncbi:MAG: citryl-CoA lyase [Burkholderiales bacterium]|nr:citryl-CoA lyase [Burkholderiales bacterium]